jgi:hypothetical protein
MLWWNNKFHGNDYKTYTFAPQKDITAYELAVIMSKLCPQLRGFCITYDQLDSLEPEIARHIKTM